MLKTHQSFSLIIKVCLGLLLFLSAPLVSAKTQCEASLQSSADEVALSLPVQHIYVEGESRSGSVLFLSGDSYQKAIQQDTLPVNTILVLDELPLTEDLPPVAALIIGKKLTMEATHVQSLAEKMSIPLVVVDLAKAKPEMQNLVQNKTSFFLRCQDARCELKGTTAPFVPDLRIKSVLPVSVDRQEKLIFSMGHPRDFTPREMAGDKYFNLMEFKRFFPEMVPDIRALSSGYFETFIDQYQYQGHALRYWHLHLLSELSKAETNNDEARVRAALAEMRRAILGANGKPKGDDLFAQIHKELVEIYGDEKIPLALRSNNDVEDLLAAGLYKSAFTSSLSADEVETGLKKIWSSLFEFRAYSIRHYWGQREETLSMPVMVHPFLENSLAHAVATFTRPRERLELRVHLVLGPDEKATNPSATASVYHLHVFRNSKNKVQLSVEGSAQEAPLASAIQRAVLKFFKQTERHITWDFTSRVYTPASATVEFVVQNKTYFWTSPQVKVLQYKPNLPREVVMSLITGDLTRDEVEKRVYKTVEKTPVDRALAELSLKRLDEKLPRVIADFVAGKKPFINSPPRYALLMENGQPFFIFWEKGLYHADVKMHLRLTDVVWVKSGYLRLKGSSKPPTLLFTDTTIDGLDRPMIVSLSKKLFQGAFDLALKENKEFRQFIEEVRPQVEFDTYEGKGILTQDLLDLK